jgi:hypothetical protein
LDPALGAGDRRGDTLTLSVDEGAVAVDALPVALEVVEAGEAALARRVRAHVRLGPERVVRLDVRLKRMSAKFNSTRGR